MAGMPKWMSLPGPQTLAAQSDATIIGYGGAAGGGKTDLICGLALTEHKRSIIYRKEGTQLQGITDRIEEIVGTRDGYSSQAGIWRYDDKIIKFAGLADPNSHKKYQGIAHDLKCFDEVTEIPETMVRFLMGWMRSSDPIQRMRVLMTFNPPTTAEGEWIIDYFGPWLDKAHHNPAEPGEIRWFTTDPKTGLDIECIDGNEFELEGELVTPISRTFIPAKVEDNPYYMDSGYKATLQAMPEPLRSQMLKGDFSAGKDDNPWQIIPTEWIEQAMERWEAKDIKPIMDSIGADIARGGEDKTVLSRRHGVWYDELLEYPGTATPDGPTSAALVVSCLRDQAPIHIDVIGWGSSAYDFLASNGFQTIPINGAEKSYEKAEASNLPFYNKRAELYWKFREMLDPVNNMGICLPPDREMKADLTSVRWKLTARGILAESKEDIAKRLHRSTDKGDAVIYASIVTMKDDGEEYDDYHYESDNAMGY